MNKTGHREAAVEMEDMSAEADSIARGNGTWVLIAHWAGDDHNTIYTCIKCYHETHYYV